MEFRDGTCAQALGDCWPGVDLVLGTPEGARAASQALLDSVLIDSILGQFDDAPNLIAGCEDPTWCTVFTPVAVVWDREAPFFPRLFSIGAANGKLVWTANWGWLGQDYIVEERFVTRVDYYPWGGYLITADIDLRQSATRTWAVWSPAASAVPEPGTIALVGIGVIGFLSRHRR